MVRLPIKLRRCLLLLSFACVLGAAGPQARAAELTFDLEIARGQVPRNMRLIRVKQGDVVTLRWRTDSPLKVHLHGYDIEKTVEPGAVMEMAFTARATGRFPVHVHTPKGSGGHSHEAPIVNVEVHPR